MNCAWATARYAAILSELTWRRAAAARAGRARALALPFVKEVLGIVARGERFDRGGARLERVVVIVQPYVAVQAVTVHPVHVIAADAVDDLVRFARRRADGRDFDGGHRGVAARGGFGRDVLHELAGAHRLLERRENDGRRVERPALAAVVVRPRDGGERLGRDRDLEVDHRAAATFLQLAVRRAVRSRQPTARVGARRLADVFCLDAVERRRDRGDEHGLLRRRVCARRARERGRG